MDARVIVPSEEFVAAMRLHWTTSLGNHTSDALEALWAIQANTFNEAIQCGDTDHKWRVLQPPTGSGKTQGACVYARLLVQRNRTAINPTGVLIVTRTIDQANELVRDIRQLLVASGFTECEARKAVTAKHSDNDTTLDEMSQADVLVICQAGYVKALDGLEAERYGRWQNYTSWLGGNRHLTIIDEMLSGIVEERRVTASDVRTVLHAMPATLKRQFAAEYEALKQVASVMDALEETEDQEGQHRVLIQFGRWLETVPPTMPQQITELQITLSREPLDVRIDNRINEERRSELADRINSTLSGVSRMITRWCFYSRNGNMDALYHAAFVAPRDLPGPVVLDATAKQHFIWHLLGDRVVAPKIPEGIRDYSNVRLHVTREKGLGKTTMSKPEVARTRLSKVVTDVTARTQGEPVLLVVHKKARPYGKTEDPTVSLAHWGAIDGKNLWQDYNTVVLFGLPYPHDTWAASMVAALRGLPNGAHHEEDVLKGLTDVRQEMTRRHIAACLLQAINRVRCRRTIDAQGRCLPTNVYLALPVGEEGDDILSYLREEMPGVQVVAWALDLGGPTTRLNANSCHPAVVEYMEHREAGRTSLNKLIKDLGLSPSMKRELQKTFRQPDHPLTSTLRARGVVYCSGGTGRKAEAYLLKNSDLVDPAPHPEMGGLLPSFPYRANPPHFPMEGRRL
jgi:hypothetical protein